MNSATTVEALRNLDRLVTSGLNERAYGIIRYAADELTACNDCLTNTRTELDNANQRIAELESQLASMGRNYDQLMRQWKDIEDLPDDAANLYKVALQSITMYPDKTHSCLDKIMNILAAATERTEKAEALCELGIVRLELCMHSIEGCREQHGKEAHTIRAFELPLWIDEMRKDIAALAAKEAENGKS